jgi:hypothetical protein
MREDGTVHPAVEAFRKYKHTELGYLTAIAEVRQAEHEEPRDLVAEMAGAMKLSQCRKPASPRPARASNEGPSTSSFCTYTKCKPSYGMDGDHRLRGS